MIDKTILTLLLSIFIAFLGIGIIIPVMPVFATTLGASGVGLGMIIAAFSITRGILLPLVGHFSDKWGRKNFLASGLCIYGIVGLLIPLAENVTGLVVIRGFHGVGSAMIVPIAMAYMSALSPPGKEGKYMGVLNMAIFSGIGCGPLIGGIIYDYFNFQAVFHLMALLSLIAFILVLIQMPRHGGTSGPKVGSLHLALFEMVRNRKTAGILLARFGTMIIMVPTMAFLPLIMSQWPNTSGLQIGIVIAARTLLNALLQIPFGKLTDSHDKLILLVVAGILLGLTMLAIPQAESFVSMLFVYLALGAIEALVWAVLGTYASIEAKSGFGHGTMMGAFSLAMSIGVFTGAMLSGISMDVLSISAAYTVTGITVMTLTLIAALLIHSDGLKN